MMKKIIYICCCIGLFACKNKSATVSIEGKVDSCNGTKVMITNLDFRNVLDSAVIENGRFKLNPSVNKEGFYQIWFKSPIVGNKSWSHMCLMYLEDKGSYTFLAGGPNDILYNRYTINTTSADQNKINELRKKENKIAAKVRSKKREFNRLTNLYLAPGKEQMYNKYRDSIYKLDSSGTAELSELKRLFISQNTGTHYTPYLISRATDRFENYVLYRKVLDKLDPKIKNSEIAKDASERLDAVKKLYKGATAPPIEGRDVHDKKVTLNYAKAEYTLINFWASYCMPCRRETPELRKLYTNYKNGKLNIISVSIDINKNHWLMASQQDSIPWMNIAELTPAQKSLNVKNFVLKIIPANYLVNRQGQIIDRDIAIPDLERLLAK